ncbi:MAG: hypothetical protein WAX44_01680 [Minisyncoccia bacterium]
MSESDVLLTEDEQVELARLMEKRALHPRQRVTLDLFLAGIKVHTSNSSEVAILRHGSNGLEIYLLQRPENDPFYAGEWHMPGVMLFYDELIHDGAVRAMKEALKEEVDPSTIPPHHQVFEWLMGNKSGHCPRGHTVCFLHTIIVSEEHAWKLTKGQFFPLKSTPTPMIEVHGRYLTWLRANLQSVLNRHRQLV